MLDSVGALHMSYVMLEGVCWNLRMWQALLLVGISTFEFKYFSLVFAGVLHLFARCCCALAKQNLFMLSIRQENSTMQQMTHLSLNHTECCW